MAKYKMKTHRGAAKRFRGTGGGGLKKLQRLHQSQDREEVTQAQEAIAAGSVGRER